MECIHRPWGKSKRAGTRTRPVYTLVVKLSFDLVVLEAPPLRVLIRVLIGKQGRHGKLQ